MRFQFEVKIGCNSYHTNKAANTIPAQRAGRLSQGCWRAFHQQTANAADLWTSWRPPDGKDRRIFLRGRAEKGRPARIPETRTMGDLLRRSSPHCVPCHLRARPDQFFVPATHSMQEKERPPRHGGIRSSITNIAGSVCGSRGRPLCDRELHRLVRAVANSNEGIVCCYLCRTIGQLVRHGLCLAYKLPSSRPPVRPSPAPGRG